MTVIYKHSAQEASLNQQDSGMYENLSAAALWRNVACGMEPGLYQAEGVALGRGSGLLHPGTWPCVDS